ncbi:MAG: MMPL family transporter, partial [Clostridiales bacterium]|nr:MMPL family transporter [Clostridiales bacterium]
WINLAFPYFSGNPLCYIGYLIISTVQLGATVDYAILLTTHYTYNRKTMTKKEALRATMRESFSSILISGSILSLSGFTLRFTSSNQIVSDLGLLLGRGTILSMLLVVFFLPALLTLLDRLIIKTTLRADFLKE